MKLKEMRDKLAGLVAEAETLIAKDTLTEVEEARSAELTPLITGLRAKIDAATAVAEQREWLDKPADNGPAIIPELKDAENRSVKPHDRILDKPFGFTERCIAVRDSARGKGIDPRFIEERAAQGMNAGVGSDGGFLIGTTSIDINKKLYSNSESLVGYTDQRVIGEGTDGAEWVDVDDGGSRKDTYRHGSVIGYYQGEADTVDFKKIKLEDGSLKLTELLCIIPATDRMLRDATGFESMAKKQIEREFAFQINRGVVAGTGAAMPLGLRNAGALKAVTKEGGQLADTILYENVTEMFAGLLPESQTSSGLVCLYHPTCFPQMSQMSITVGGGGGPVWMPAGGISGRPYQTFFGFPAFPCEFLPELGNANDIMFVDLEEYLWIYKGDITMDISIHVYFTSNQTLFRFKQAVNGMPKHDRATTLYEGTGTVSPYVGIAERA